MEYFTAETYRNWTRVGDPFTKNGKLYTEVKEPCPRCGGAPRIAAYAHVDGGICWKCGGAGFFSKTVRLYTEKELSAQNRVKEQRAAASLKKANERNEKFKHEWPLRNGFNEDGFTYLIYGNTYPIKDRLKEEGCKFSPELKWHSPKEIEGLPNDCGQEKIAFDQLYRWNDWYKVEAEFIGAQLVEEIFQKTTSTSEFIGSVGERLRALDVILKESKYLDSYGYYIHTFLYGDNLLSWSTSKDLEFEVGDEVELTGTVKAHKIFAGNKVTYLNRCIIKVI